MVSVAIICEGKNDRDFCKELITHLGFHEHHVNFYTFGGKSKLFDSADKKYDDLKLDIDSNQIEKVLFVVDADNIENDAIYGGYQNTQTALNDIIDQLGFQDISNTYIVCDPATKTGYLESFILSTIPDAQRKCIECFLDCSQFKSKENHKAILNQIYNIAYPNAPYDFEHAHFAQLKTELIRLFS